VPLNLTIVNQLMQPSSTPLIIFGCALFGAIAGGVITYIVTYQRQKYEVRRDAYFAFLDFGIEGRYPQDPQFKRDLLIAQSKIELIGSKQIKEVSTKMVHTLYPDVQTLTMVEKVVELCQFNTSDKWEAFEHICNEDFKPTLRKELGRWWRFWK